MLWGPPRKWLIISHLRLARFILLAVAINVVRIRLAIAFLAVYFLRRDMREAMRFVLRVEVRVWVNHRFRIHHVESIPERGKEYKNYF